MRKLAAAHLLAACILMGVPLQDAATQVEVFLGDSTGRTDRLLTPQLSDERSDPKFQVAVSRQTAPENETEALAQLEVVRMKDSRGREFNCYLPAAADGTADGDRREPEPQLLPSELLKDLSGKCFHRDEEWWTYQLCYQKQVLQFHKHGEEIAGEYSLGVFSGNATAVDDIHYDGPTGFSTAFVRESYEGGTACDVADRERTTDLRYICANDGLTRIASVKELHSCSYQITLATPLICKNPAFKSVEVPVEDIKCYPLVESDVPDKQLSGAADSAGSQAVEGRDEAGASAAWQSSEPADEQETDADATVSIDLGELKLDDAMIDEIISKLMSMAQEQPDSEFLDYSEEEEEKSLRPDREL